ncbi:MAG: hypothetical protein QME74_07845, partial [Candidatus Edwardsbacteria bacterium]|nr:hypothetical protein [Candidatus Edwardsbacteria bacterium]
MTSLKNTPELFCPNMCAMFLRHSAGSLATGSYVPGPGDIDQITIIRDSAPDSAVAMVQQIRQSVIERHERAINIADVVYRRAELDRPWQTVYDLQPETRHHVTVPEELLRISDHGQIVYGNSEYLHSLETPAIQEMAEYHRRWRIWGKEIKQQRQDIAENTCRPTVRLAVQSILSKAQWHYYYYTQGHTCFNKHIIARKIREAIPEYMFLETLDIATEIRLTGNFDPLEAEEKRVLSGYKALFEW